VKELGDTYYPKGAFDYPDKHRRRIALAAMNDIPVATFDFAMCNYRQMKGWVDDTVAKAALKGKTVVKATVKAAPEAPPKAAAKAANRAWIALICRVSRQTRKVAFVSVKDAWKDFYRYAREEEVNFRREEDRRVREAEKADREYMRGCLHGRSVWAMGRSGSERS
jgi:hypothetical protein